MADKGLKNVILLIAYCLFLAVWQFYIIVFNNNLIKKKKTKEYSTFHLLSP